MLKRFFSSMSINKLNCYDCRFYNNKTKLCKINKLNAIENRMDDNICGIVGKKFMSLDKTNLIESDKCDKYSNISGFLTIASLPILYYNVYFLWFPLSSFMVTSIFVDLSKDFKNKYINDNNIRD